jgi:predicted PurR-regulated permease PerM
VNDLLHVLSIITGPFIWGLLFGWLTHPLVESLRKRSATKRKVVFDAEYRRKEVPQ